MSHQPAPLPADMRHDYAGLCWWCSRPADSREHRHKKTDLIREFGKGPFVGGSALVRVRGGAQQPIQGPKSDSLKFGKSLCQDCNNSRSQPFDLAYDVFAAHVAANDEEIVKHGGLRLDTLYGNQWKTRRDDLVRYFIKHVACRLAEDGVQVPNGLLGYLNGDIPKPEGLILHVNVRLDILGLRGHRAEVHGIPSGFVWLGDSEATYSYSRRTVNTVSSSSGVGALCATYMVDFNQKYFRSNLNGKKVRMRGGRNFTKEEILNACKMCSGELDAGVPTS